MSVHHKRKNFVLKVISLFIELVWLPWKFFAKKIDLSSLNPHKILLLRLDHIGDVVMTSPAFSLLKSRFPNAKIFLLTDNTGRELFKSDPLIDHIFAFNWPWTHQKNNNRFTYSKFKELVRLIKNLRKEKIDVCVDFRGDLRFVILFGILSGAKIRIGNNRTGQTSLLHYSSNYNKSMHEVERALDVVKCFAKPEGKIRPKLVIHEHEIHAVKSLTVSQTNYPFPLKIAIIAPYSSQDIKSWPLCYFNEVIKHLQVTGFVVIVAGTQDDVAASNELVKGFSGNVYSFAGKTSIRELAALVSLSSLVVGVDTGVLHIASCFNVPIVAIFGATRPVEFRPYSPFTRIVESGTCTCNRFLHLKCEYPCNGYAMCLHNTSPEMVKQAIDEVLITDRSVVKAARL